VPRGWTEGCRRFGAVAQAPGRHDPGKIVTDLALALAVGGDCLADVAVLRAEPALFGPVASDPTVSRLVDTLAADADRALAAIDAARAAARARVWAAAGQHAPNHAADADSPVVIDVVAHPARCSATRHAWALPGHGHCPSCRRRAGGADRGNRTEGCRLRGHLGRRLWARPVIGCGPGRNGHRYGSGLRELLQLRLELRRGTAPACRIVHP